MDEDNIRQDKHFEVTMKIGLRLPQTGKKCATRENIVHVAKFIEGQSIVSQLLHSLKPQIKYILLMIL
jgi:hypothetical protein